MPTPEKHALLSASASSRWLNCTAAPRFEEQFPETTSQYAEEGRIAHAMCELKVLKTFTAGIKPRSYTARINKIKEMPGYSSEMDRTSDLYIEHLSQLALSYKAKPNISPEVQVDLTGYIPGGFGTCDCIMIGGDTLSIVDYKHGKGVPVSAEGNTQMRLYALGALKRYSPVYGNSIKSIRMTIDQPRISDEVSTETISVEELLAWGESIKPIAQEAYTGPGKFVPGEHCRFCRGKEHCRARAEQYTALEEFKDCVLPGTSGDQDKRILSEGRLGRRRSLRVHAERQNRIPARSRHAGRLRVRRAHRSGPPYDGRARQRSFGAARHHAR